MRNKTITLGNYEDELINWNAVINNYDCSEDFIRKFRHKWTWEEIMLGQQEHLPLGLLREFKDELTDGGWSYACATVCPDDAFIREFQDKLDFDILIEMNALSEDIIEEFHDKWDYDTIADYQSDYVSKKFLKKLKKKYYTNNIVVLVVAK